MRPDDGAPRAVRGASRKKGQFSPIAISIRWAGFWMADLPAAFPQYRLTPVAAPTLKRSASHAFVTLVLCQWRGHAWFINIK